MNTQFNIRIVSKGGIVASKASALATRQSGMQCFQWTLPAKEFLELLGRSGRMELK